MNFSIISYKPPHDGSFVWVNNGKLEFSIEGEKDSQPRYAGISSFSLVMRVLLERLEAYPDVIAWGCGSPSSGPDDIYFGTSPELIKIRETKKFGKQITTFQTTHERAHIFCSYGLSPFPQGQPVYVLVWEGAIGKFYEIDEKMNIHDF